MRSFLLKVSVLCLVPLFVFAQQETNEGGSTFNPIVRVNPLTEQVESSEIFFTPEEPSNKDNISTKKGNDTEIVLRTFSVLREKAEDTREVLIVQLQSLIDTGIATIREVQPQSPFELKRLVDPTRDDTIETIVAEMMDFDNIKNPDNFDGMITFLEERIDIIKKTLEKKGGVSDIDVTIERVNLVSLLKTYKTAIVSANNTLAGADLLSAVTESDEDGLSDFFEESILNTDHTKSSTIGGSSTDKEVFIIGKNPRDLDLERNSYYIEDIKNVHNGEELKIENIVKKPLVVDGIPKIKLEGYGVPGGIVTVFFTPLNLVVTTGVDMTGKWSHILASEIPTGQYDVVLALLEAGGAIVTVSDKYSITVNENEIIAQTIPKIDPVIQNETIKEEVFFQETGPSRAPFERFIRAYFFLIVGGIALLGLIVSVLIIKGGSHKKYGGYYQTMRTDGPSVSPARGRSLYESLDEEE